MNPYRQNPDLITPRIRAEYKSLGVAFIEPPPGFGCDFVVGLPGDIGKLPDMGTLFPGKFIFIEVKSPGKSHNFTQAEARLMKMCTLFGQRYIIVTTLDEALSAAGFTVE